MCQEVKLHENKIPKWIDENFLNDIIKEFNVGSFKIKSYNVELEVDKGDNCSPMIFKVFVTFNSLRSHKKKTFVILVKTLHHLPHSMVNYEIVEQIKLFHRENEFLLTTLEDMKNWYWIKIGKNLSLSAKVVATKIDNTIILEDLRTEGFRMAHQYNSLDYDHTFIALDNLAKFHAVSYYMKNELRVDLETKYSEHILKEDNIILKNYGKHFEYISNVFEGHPEGKKYVQRIRLISQHVGKFIVDVANFKGLMNCLIHGNFLGKNMLFKYSDNNKVQDVRFIDFQSLRWNNPVMDILNLFFSSSIQENVRFKDGDKLLEIYYNSLVKYLRQFGHNNVIFTFTDFLTDLKEYGLFALVVASTLMPLVIADENNAPELRGLTEENFEDKYFKKMKRIYRTEKFQQTYLRLHKDAIDRGFLNP